jgi:DNA-binding FadR family transcriptional regulator
MPPTTHIQRYIAQARVGNLVADVLRQRIVDGSLQDGDLLPRQDDLVAEFNVSPPSIREAMRILETEGLLSVRRGNVGGARVHAPKPESAAYLLGLVLQTQRVTNADVGRALAQLEPVCAALAAQADVRPAGLVPRLRALNEELHQHLEDPVAFTALARQFHDTVVKECGNTTMALVVGMVETLWTTYETSWADRQNVDGSYPSVEARRSALRAHMALSDAIAKGDVERARRLSARHLADAQHVVLASAPERSVETRIGRAR